MAPINMFCGARVAPHSVPSMEAAVLSTRPASRLVLMRRGHMTPLYPSTLDPSARLQADCTAVLSPAQPPSRQGVQFGGEARPCCYGVQFGGEARPCFLFAMVCCYTMILARHVDATTASVWAICEGHVCTLDVRQRRHIAAPAKTGVRGAAAHAR